MIELNLLPDVKLEFVHAQKARRRVISGVTIGGLVAVGLVAALAIYAYPVQSVWKSVVDGGIGDKSKKLSAVADLNTNLTIQQQLKDLSALHEAKPIYSRIIGYLPALNPAAPNNIHVTQVAFDGTVNANVMKLQGYTATYTAATVFESTLKSALINYSLNGTAQKSIPLFSDVNMTDTSLGQDSSGNKVVTFTIMLTVDSHAFSFDATNVGISVPNKDATNSAESVFSATTGGTQ